MSDASYLIKAVCDLTTRARASEKRIRELEADLARSKRELRETLVTLKGEVVTLLVQCGVLTHLAQNMSHEIFKDIEALASEVV